SYWTDVSEQRIMLSVESEVSNSVTQYRTLALEYDAFIQQIANAPLAFTEAARNNPAEVDFPLPDGTTETFEVVESRTMAPELAAKYSNIRTYAATSKENPFVSARFEVTKKGLTIGISTPEGRFYIEPYSSEENRYYVFYSKGDVSAVELEHLHDEHERPEHQITDQESLFFRNFSSANIPLRTYRFAPACTGEFAQFEGGTLDDVMSAFAVMTNRLNEILQTEAAITFEIIPDIEELINFNSSTDPFLDGNDARELFNQISTYISSTIGADNYDVGHMFTGPCVGGVAGVGSTGGVCSQNKGWAVTCITFGNIFLTAERILAHEVGHQLDGLHSFNNCPGSLDQLTPGDAFEPGAGTTIMSYAGACGNQNIDDPEPYFHVGSLEDIIEFTRVGAGADCGTEIISENHEPEIQMPYEDGFFIPISTPFELSATATDEDGDNLTYIWEQFDLGPVSSIGNPSGNAPLFRSFLPTANGHTRVFPRMSKILNNNFDNTEVLPTYSRDMTFQFVVRDNNADHGAVVWEPVAFRADGTAGPFTVLTANSINTTWTGGEYREVNWDVANTTNQRVNCQYVDVLLSIDGGSSYPYTLIEATPNDGSV
ncbi:MAG: hypothetical protein KI786_05285, partial [Mameliella sp.]|nr:hypothetical protein [Phaeodactylibacter sp.]